MSGLESFSNGHMSNVDAPEKHRSSLRGRRNLKRTINHLHSDSESFEFASTSSRQESRADSDDESDERPKFYMSTGSGDFRRWNDYDLRGPSSSSYSLGDLPGLAPNDNHKAPKENDAPLSPNFGNSANKDFRPPLGPILRVLNSSDCDMSEAETTISHIVSTGDRPWQFTWADDPERPYHPSRVFFCVAPTGGQQKRREQERNDRRKSVEMSKWHWICVGALSVLVRSVLTNKREVPTAMRGTKCGDGRFSVPRMWP